MNAERLTDDALEIGDRKLRIGERTELLRDGERVGREEVRPGDEVRASFDAPGDELEARRVEIRREAG